MSLKRHNLIREKVAITSLILTGRLTRPLPIIRGTTESPATCSPPALLNSGDPEQSPASPCARTGRECRGLVSTLNNKIFAEGAIPPHPEEWGGIARSK